MSDTSSPLTGKQVAFLVAHEGIEQVELVEPWKAVEQAGGTPKLVSPEPGTVQAFNHLDKADTFVVDVPVGDADPATFDALVLPGGVANPDALRTDPGAVAFAKAFMDAGKPVAAICHAAWTLVEGDCVRAARSRPGPACRPTSATPAAPGRRGGRGRRQPDLEPQAG